MLDNDSPLPLYYQLRKAIADRIDTGQWQPGDRVPSESELGKQFGVSRTTVRQALGDLANQGLLTRIQGRGTFVAQARIHQPLNRLTSFTQDMHARGKRAGSRLLQFEVTPALPPTARCFGVKPGDPVVTLKRLRLAEEVPLAVETAHLDYALCKALIQQDLNGRSLYDALESDLGIVPSRARQELEAVICPPVEARLLAVRRGSPALHILRVTYDQHDRPFEHVESYYRGDRYVFHAVLSGEAI